jgi:hypothetical protein
MPDGERSRYPKAQPGWARIACSTPSARTPAGGSAHRPGAAHEIQLDQPYLPLIQPLGDLLSPLRIQQLHVLADHNGRLDPIWLAVAACVLPILAEWLPDLPSPPPLDPKPEQVRLLEALPRLILAYRGEDARANPTVWVSLAEIDRGARPQRLALEGISTQETGELVRKILELARPAPLFERQLYTQTQGNPFFSYLLYHRHAQTLHAAGRADEARS